MSIEREDLVWIDRSGDGYPSWGPKPVSDADLAALGYYRLDVDVEALPSVRDALLSYRELVPNAAAINEAVALIGQVLAALDGGQEDTDV